MTTNRHRGWQERKVCSVARVRIASPLRSAVLADATVRIVECTTTKTEKAEGSSCFGGVDAVRWQNPAEVAK